MPENQNKEKALTSVHTNTFVDFLKQSKSSLAVTTYQAGRLILVREDNGVINTHFREFNKPMGLASNGQRIALGTASEVWELHNVPAIASRVQQGRKPDACFVPRNVQITGDVDIHEMAWVDKELWFINTRFSCLCSLDKEYSFVPRWRPPFVSSYDMRDRCHLNGLAIRDNKPRYVTALGQTDQAGGWRKNKANGGMLMDLKGDKLLCNSLSMPHSPRWYQDKLWVLESGKGTLAQINPATGELTTVVELPGFTRGLDFIGDFAFIGLSQVRETAVFAGLPLTKTQPVRYSGVWIVNIKTGEIAGFLRFESGVEEVFSVSVLPYQYPDVFNHDQAIIGGTYVLPDEALKNAEYPSENWEFAESHYEQGNTLFNQGKVKESITCYQKALELREDFLPARFNYSLALSNLEQYDEAIEQLKKVISEESGHAEAYNSLGFIHFQKKDMDLAREYLQKAIEIRPDYEQAKQNLEKLKLHNT